MPIDLSKNATMHPHKQTKSIARQSKHKTGSEALILDKNYSMRARFQLLVGRTGRGGGGGDTVRVHACASSSWLQVIQNPAIETIESTASVYNTSN